MAVPELGQCTKVVMLWDATEWVENEEGWGSDRLVKEKYDTQMSFVQDASDYRAYLWTKPEFFCAHFTLKRRKNPNDL